MKEAKVFKGRKKWKSFVLVMAIIYAVTFNCNQVMAGSGGVVSNVTATSFYLDWSGVTFHSNCYSKYVVVEGVRYDVAMDSTGQTFSGFISGQVVSWDVYEVWTDASGEAVESLVDGGIVSLDADLTQNVPQAPTYTPETPSTVDNPHQDTSIVSTALQTPNVSTVILAEDKLGVAASGYDSNTVKIEWEVADVKAGYSVVKSDDSYSAGTYIYGVPRKLLAVRCRAVAYDSDYNDVYSNWSNWKYAVAQPKVSTNKKYLHKNSVTVKFNKIKGVKNYTIYMKKHNSKKWSKVKTTSKNKVNITKFKGKRLNLLKNSYDICVVSNAKVGSSKVKSEKAEYIYTRYYVY